MANEMDDYIYMITPNQRMMRVDNVTIPNLQSRQRVLESQLAQIPQALHKTQSSDDISKLQDAEKMTNFELKYVKSYLSILEKLKSVESCSSMCGEYDYEKEDEILDSIGKEMNELKKVESEMLQFQCRGQGVSSNRCKGASHIGTDGKVSEEFVEEVRDVKT